MTRATAILFSAWVGATSAQTLETVPPQLTADGRAAYSSFLGTNLPRAFAVGGATAYGWHGGEGTAAAAQASALAGCAGRGATDCKLYAVDLALAGQPARRRHRPGHSHPTGTTA